MSAVFQGIRLKSSHEKSLGYLLCRRTLGEGMRPVLGFASTTVRNGAWRHSGDRTRGLFSGSLMRDFMKRRLICHLRMCRAQTALDIPFRRLSAFSFPCAHANLTVSSRFKCAEQAHISPIVSDGPLHVQSQTLPPGRFISSCSQRSVRETWNTCADIALDRDRLEAEDIYVKELGEALLGGQRWALARAITLVEATHKKGKRQAQILLRKVLDHLGEVQLHNRGIPLSFRIGLTGPPGAGKSTFIEAMGKKLTSEGHRVAVLAVDPSSSITGGSLLGDKTRMTELSRDPNAYIRASPSSGTLGGVTRNTNDTILLCEAAGYDVVLVETIGVGQSEYVVADMVDMLVLLIPPASGDELQGLKKGIVERADFILVNKADGELLIPARRMRSEYTSAVKLMYKRSPLWKPIVKQVSSRTGDGLDQAWDIVEKYRGIMRDAGELARRRQLQRRVWMWQHIQDRMMEEFRETMELRPDIHRWEEEVMAGRCTSGIAADKLLKRFSELARRF